MTFESPFDYTLLLFSHATMAATCVGDERRLEAQGISDLRFSANSAMVMRLTSTELGNLTYNITRSEVDQSSRREL